MGHPVKSPFWIFSDPAFVENENNQESSNADHSSEDVSSIRASISDQRIAEIETQVFEPRPPLLLATRRRSSLPTKVLDSRESLEVLPHLKRTKSTPSLFAPLCLIENPDLRHLHNCTSHSNLPHLGGGRRMSCPQPPIEPFMKLEASAATRRRRQSFPASKTDPNTIGHSLHRCRKTTSASLTNIPQSVANEVSQDSNEYSPLSFHSTPEPCIDPKQINGLARSIHLLENWSTHIIDKSTMNSAISLIRREDSHVSCKSSLNSICEEDRSFP